MISDSDPQILRALLRWVVPESWPSWVVPLGGALAAVAVVLGIATVVALLGTWAERKVAGRIQSRYGPTRVGPAGLLVSLADGVKLLLKEDIVPMHADRVLFVFAPAVVLSSIFAAFAAFPLSPEWVLADIDLGVFFLLATSSLATIGVVMAGWASNSKWSLLGAMREAAQVVAYEIPLGLALLVPLLIAGTFDLREASALQSDWFGMRWICFQNPFALPAGLIFAIAVLAETKRAPFDLPETESELVAGFLTEYSGIRWSFFFMEEYAAMFLFSAVAAVFWFGGFNSPASWAASQWLGEQHVLVQLVGAGTLAAKAAAGVFAMMWVRWTLPRLRIDQVMTLGYKYLTPLALGCLAGAGAWEALRAHLEHGA